MVPLKLHEKSGGKYQKGVGGKGRKFLREERKTCVTRVKEGHKVQLYRGLGGGSVREGWCNEKL